MVDLSGVGPLQPVRSTVDRSVQESAARAPVKGTPFAERPPSQIVELAAEISAETVPVDQAKVARLRAALASGSLPVDAEQIADRLLGKSE